MIAKKHITNHKSSWLVLSLVLHFALVAAIIASYMQKHLNPMALIALQNQHQAPIQQVQQPIQKEKEKPKQAPQAEKAKPQHDKPFVVPAPVVFYGNQAMMNNPTPIAGHTDGKSAFEENPSVLPTPPTATIAPEKTQAPQSTNQPTLPNAQHLPTPQPTITPAIEKIDTIPAPEKITQEKEGVYIKPRSEKKPSAANVDMVGAETNQELPPHKEPVKKTLTLADIFKNAPTTLAALTQTGEPSAKKAGTQGGDSNGSGHQLTIKEGDMKYYSLWAKFLNHLNQAARFSRRGKERRIQQLLQSGEITYLMQCAITIDMQGKLLDIEILHTSGNREFDAICIDDIKSAIPYPPLPDTLGKKTARFEVNVYPS